MADEIERIHVCCVCQKSFGRLSSLKRHQLHCIYSQNEERQRIYTCEECGLILTRKDSLQRHVQRIHQQVDRDDHTLDPPAKRSRQCEQETEDITDDKECTTLSIDSELVPAEALPPQLTTGLVLFNDEAMQISSAPTFDDKQLQPLVTEDQDLNKLLRDYWGAIKSYIRRGKVTDIVNIRLWNDEEDYNSGVWDLLQHLWRSQPTRMKINCSVGVILRHKTTHEVRYYHSSSNNATLFESPRSISTGRELLEFYNDFVNIDVRERGVQRRPNTAWQLHSVANVTFYLYKLSGMGKVGSAPIALPDYISKPRHIISLNRDKKTGLIYDDNLCFFRCLALVTDCQCKTRRCSCVRPRESTVYELYERFSRHTDSNETPENFMGIECGDMLMLEKLFALRIVVMELMGDQKSNVVWSSATAKGKSIYLNLYKKHFSLIKDINQYAKAFSCPTCQATYSTAQHIFRHSCNIEGVTKLKFPGGDFSPDSTIFTKLKECSGIEVKDSSLLFYPYRITYDIECFLPKSNLPSNTPTMEFTSRHEFLSVSACSNVPGFELPKCFVRDINDCGSTKCIGEFVDYLLEVSSRAGDLMTERFDTILKSLDEIETDYERKEDAYVGASFSNKRTYKSRAKLSGIKDSLLTYLKTLPVVGFNSQRYDLQIIKADLMRELVRAGEKLKFVVKKTNNMVCIETTSLRFLDICNFIAPGYSYDKYLKAFECAEDKGFFPYEWMDSLEKLDACSLPTKEEFFNSLTETHLSAQNYQLCQTIWKSRQMETFRDFLVWYNNLDVTPFLEALEKQSDIYKSKGIDMLKSAISLPGLAVRWLFSDTHQPTSTECDNLNDYLKVTQPVQLIDDSNKDLHKLIRENLVGGPSIIFHRRHEKDSTRIRHRKYANEAKTCGQIVGFDANALYLWCMMQNMPTGYPIRRLEEHDYIPERLNFSKVSHAWLEYIMWVEKVQIRHRLRGGEIRLGQHGLPVDGYCENTRTVYQFHGCFWHGHDCHKTEGIIVHPISKIPMKNLLKDTSEKESYLRHLGYKVVTMWECQWEEQVDNHPSIKGFLKSFYSAIYGEKSAMKLEEVVNKIRQGEFYGFIECDISVPDALTEKFEEMAPIFKNVDVTRDHLSSHMREFAESKDFLKQPQRMLVGSLRGEKILLMSDLAKWYLEHGLCITRVYQLIEYVPRKVFEGFGESVSEARRRGDANPALALLASTSKLVGNSVYGKTITNKEKHMNVHYIDGDSAASKKIRGNNFVSLEEIGEEFYEIVTHKRQISLNVPETLGFAILQLAKLRMLQFYYDFMDRFVDRRDFEYVEMDTDSAYMALSRPLQEIITPSRRQQFYQDYDKWFPKPYCGLHKDEFIHQGSSGTNEWTRLPCCETVYAHDIRTPGLFKDEFKGTGIIALNSKTYFCWNEDGDDSKYSSKGLSKKTNRLTREHFTRVIDSQISHSGVNKGFVKKNNTMYTYSQLRCGLTYFYAKRKVCDDGVSTMNIDI